MLQKTCLLALFLLLGCGGGRQHIEDLSDTEVDEVLNIAGTPEGVDQPNQEVPFLIDHEAELVYRHGQWQIRIIQINPTKRLLPAKRTISLISLEDRRKMPIVSTSIQTSQHTITLGPNEGYIWSYPLNNKTINPGKYRITWSYTGERRKRFVDVEIESLEHE